jgi:hypothetical protein
MRIEQLLQQSAVLPINRPPLHEDLAQGPVVSHRPGVHRLNQLVAGDEVVLQRRNAQQQISVTGLGPGRIPEWSRIAPLSILSQRSTPAEDLPRFAGRTPSGSAAASGSATGERVATSLGQ